MVQKNLYYNILKAPKIQVVEQDLIQGNLSIPIEAHFINNMHLYSTGVLSLEKIMHAWME